MSADICPGCTPENCACAAAKLAQQEPWGNIDNAWEPRGYVAANLLEALKLVKDTGDWHGQLKAWCEYHLEKQPYSPNVTAEAQTDWSNRGWMEAERLRKFNLQMKNIIEDLDKKNLELTKALQRPIVILSVVS
jgi:hypothetical protein